MNKQRFDEPAFDRIFEAECRHVVRASYLVVGDWELAQEIAQDAFAELLVRWTKVSQYDNPGAWLRRVAIRRAVRVRSRRRVVTDELHLSAEGDEAATLGSDLRVALLCLPPRQRAAIVLFYLEDLSVADVAEVLQCSASTVKVHLHRGREALRDALPMQTVSGDPS